MLGLGMSIGTPPGGITADVVAVETFDDLAKLGREKIQGKIVVYNEEYRGYGPTRVLPRHRRVARRRIWRRGAFWCARPRRSPCRFRIPAR